MKKGDLPMQMVMMGVVLGFVLLVISLIYIQVKEEYEDTLDKGECYNQIRSHAALQKFTREEFVSKIDCPTKVVHMKESSEEELRERVAEEMVECWQLWGEGEFQLFDDEEAVFCHVCTAIYPEGTPLSGIEQYLRDEPYNKTHSYIEYFTKYHGGLFKDIRFQKQAVWQGTSARPVGIIFRYEKGWTTREKIQNMIVGDPVNTGVLGGATGIGAVGGITAGVVSLGVVSTTWPVVVAGSAVALVAGGTGFVGGAAYAIFEGKTISQKIVTIHSLVLTDENVQKLGCEKLPT